MDINNSTSSSAGLRDIPSQPTLSYSPQLVALYASIANDTLGHISDGLAQTGTFGATAGNILKQAGTSVIGNTVNAVASNALKEGAKSVTMQGLKNGLKAGLSNTFSFSDGLGSPGVGMVANIGSAILGGPSEYNGKKGNITKGLDTAYDAITSGVSFIPGVGLAIAGGMAVNKLAGRALSKLGAGTDGMTTADAILGSSFFGSSLGALNGAFGKSTSTLSKNDEVYSDVAGSYNSNKMDYAMTVQGKKYGLVSGGARKKAQKAIWEAGLQQNYLTDLVEDKNLTNDAIGNTLDTMNVNYANQINGGFQPLMAAKLGTKLFSKELILRIKNIKQIDKYKKGGNIDSSDIISFLFNTDSYFSNDIESFKQGGLMNVIPEGALHARLHHMEDDENITKKGIPVVIEKEGGEIEQQAEIECNEIIFIKEVTQKLEEYLKKYYSDDTSEKEKDELAIKAGKLLTEEIMENTDDKTNLINTI